MSDAPTLHTWKTIDNLTQGFRVPGGTIYSVPNVLLDGELVAPGGPVFVPDPPKLRRVFDEHGGVTLAGPQAVIAMVDFEGRPAGAHCEVRYTAGDAFVARGSPEDVAAALGLEIAP